MKHSCRVSVEDRQKYYLVKVQGSYVNQNPAELKKFAEDALGKGHKIVLIDLCEATAIDSRGIGIIINLQKYLITKGAELSLATTSNRMYTLLNSCNLKNVLKIYRNVEEAEKDFGKNISLDNRGFYTRIKIPTEFDLLVIKQLKEAIDESIESGNIQIVLDFEETMHISSVGIGSLINLYKKVNESKGKIHLVNISPDVRSLLEDTNVLELLPKYKNLNEIEEKLLEEDLNCFENF